MFGRVIKVVNTSSTTRDISSKMLRPKLNAWSNAVELVIVKSKPLDGYHSVEIPCKRRLQGRSAYLVSTLVFAVKALSWPFSIIHLLSSLAVSCTKMPLLTQVPS